MRTFWIAFPYAVMCVVMACWTAAAYRTAAEHLESQANLCMDTWRRQAQMVESCLEER